MTVSVPLRVVVAVAVGAALLVFDGMWDDIFFPDFRYFEATENGVMHIVRTPSRMEVILRIAIPLLVLAGAAAYVARISKNHRILTGALASTGIALVALVAIHNVYAPNLGLGYIPRLINVAVWGIVSFAIGAVAAWAAIRWPNTSVERTRDR